MILCCGIPDHEIILVTKISYTTLVSSPSTIFSIFLSQSYLIQLSPDTVIVLKKNAVVSIYSYNAWNYFDLQYLSSKSSITCWRMLFGLAPCQAVKSVQLTLNRHPPRLRIDSIKLKHSSTVVKCRSLDCIKHI